MLYIMQRIVKGLGKKHGKNIKIIKNYACKNKKLKSTFDLLGCDVKYFINHIEKQFQTSMSWNDWGIKGWHIDHIRPCCSFDLANLEQQKLCFHYSNLRPLWAVENIKKAQEDRKLKKISKDKNSGVKQVEQLLRSI